MPTVKLDLGRYVVLKARKDGTFRVLFQVPERLRPSDWLPAIPLPRSGKRTGNLRSATEVAAIQRDAKALYEELQQRRAGRPVEDTGRTFKALVRAWQGTSAWNDLRPKTITGYQTGINSLLAWSEAKGHPDPTTLTIGAVEGFLALFNGKPRTKRNTLDVLRMVMAQAVAKGWRPDNPCDGIRVRLPKTRAQVWEQADVEAYTAAAAALRRASIALVIRLEWEIGQRLTDVRAFRPGAEYVPAEGIFRFHQQKTDSYVTVPVSPELQQLLNAAGEDALFIFRDESTGKAYTESRLTHVFDEVRAAAVAGGARRLVLRWLRHSCVVQLARAGCEIPEIAAITGHSLRSATNILQTYLPRDSQVARNAQIKRGLIAR